MVLQSDELAGKMRYMSRKKNSRIKQILREHWDDFYEKHQKHIRPVVVREVTKVLKCMDIANGYTEYRCVK